MYTVRRTGSPSRWYFASPTIPTISYATPFELTRRPSADPSLNKYQAKLSLTMATRGEVHVSAGLNSRPASSGVPIVLK